MRSIYGPGRLLLSSKKPKIINLIKSIEHLSYDEIKKLPEKADVIRGLLEIKQLGTKKGLVSELIADKMQNNYVPTTTKNISNIYQYHGDSVWLKIKSSELLLEPQWYWQEIDTNKIYVSSNLIDVTNDILHSLKNNSTYIKCGNIDDLKLLERDRVSKIL